MAMEDRQKKIVEGAGLEESRVNQDLIDALRKWSTPVLVLVLIVAGSYAGYQWWQREQVKALDSAFLDLAGAQDSGSPEALLAVAADHPDRAAVAQIARLRAADVFLQSYLLRREPGAVAGEDGRIDEAQAREYLDRAEGVYQTVYDSTRGRSGHAVHELGARWGLVAVAIGKRDIDEARAGLDEIIERAQELGYADWVTRAENLRDRLPEMVEMVPLPEGEPPAEEAAAEDGAAEDAPADEAPQGDADQPADEQGEQPSEGEGDQAGGAGEDPQP